MPTYKVTDPQNGKTLRLTGDSPPTEEELNDIFSQVGGTDTATIDRPQNTSFLPRETEVEKMISERPDSVSRLKEEINKPYTGNIFQKGIKTGVTGLKTVAVPFQRLESGVAGLGLGLQKGKPMEGLKRAGQGLIGRRQQELGDLIRTTGFGGQANELIAKGVGFAGSAGVSNIATAGKIVPILNKAEKIAKAGRPRIMNDNWFVEQADNAQEITGGIRKALGNSYDEIYSKVNNIKVNPDAIDDILLKSGLDDIVLKDIDNLVGGRVDTVQKAKMVSDILQKRTPQSFYLSGGTSGKGGLTNPKIRQMSSYRAIKEVVDDSISAVDPAAGARLKQLNNFAHTKVYPILDQMDLLVGRKEIPKTSGIANVFSIRNMGAASQRKAIRSVPKISNDFKSYVATNYKKDLGELVKNSKQLVKGMNAYRKRALLKTIAATGLIYGGGRLILNKVAGGGE